MGNIWKGFGIMSLIFICGGRITDRNIGEYSEGSFSNNLFRVSEVRRNCYYDDLHAGFEVYWKARLNPLNTSIPPIVPVWQNVYLDGKSGEELILKSYSVVTFNIKVSIIDQNEVPEGAGFHISGSIKRGNQASTTILIGNPIIDSWKNDELWDARVVANTDIGSLRLQVKIDVFNNCAITAVGWCSEVIYQQ